MVAEQSALLVSMLFAKVPKYFSLVVAVKAANGTYVYVVLWIWNNFTLMIIVDHFWPS